MEIDFGKSRVYRCQCGGSCLRRLHGDPPPCERCGAQLVGRPYTIDDRQRFADRILGRIEERGQ